MILDDVRKALARAKDDLGAASCTFYVRDSFWPDEQTERRRRRNGAGHLRQVESAWGRGW